LSIAEISPREFIARRAAGNEMKLIDVREDWELKIAPVPSDHLHLPMNEIPTRIGELEPGAENVIICRSGGRSMQVARYLERQGFSNVKNLSGGILAWSHDVDPTIATY
jgi:rhodanese-related sulfurtransferase